MPADAPLRAPRKPAKPRRSKAAPNTGQNVLIHALGQVERKAGNFIRRHAPTSRGPQGLPTQATSTQRPTKPRPRPKPARRRTDRTSLRTQSVQRGQRQKHSGRVGQFIGMVGHEVENELEGKGALAAMLKAASEHANIRPSGQKTVVETAGFPLKDSDTANLGLRVAKDLINFPAVAVPSVYVPAKAAVQAATGNTRPAKQFIRDFKDQDPIYNLLTGNVDKALELANEHPGFAALEGTGFLRGGDVAAGRVGRSGALGKTVKKAASRERAPRTVEGTALLEERLYPKGVVAKQVVKGRENSKRQEAGRLRVLAERAESRGEQDRAVDLLRKANRKDPDVMPAKEIKRQTTELFSANEEVRREHRGKVIHDVEQALKGTSRSEKKALSTTVQRITGDKADVQAYIHELAAEHPMLGDSGKKANENLRHQLQEVVDGKVDMRKVEAAAERYRKISQDLQDKLVSSKLISRDEADLARLTPYATRKMGATFDHETQQLVVGDRPLDAAAIRAHMKANGVKESAFLTQAPNMRGGKNFYASSARMQTMRSDRRTGAATTRGTFDPHPDTLVENAAKAQGLVDAVDGWKRFVEANSVRHDQTGKPRVYSYRQAQRVADDLNARGKGTEFTVIRAHPFGTRKELVQELLDFKQADQAKGYRDLLVDALSPQGDKGGGHWTVVPKAAAEELSEHLSSLSPSEHLKAFGAINSAFRQTVLATSLSWLTGNITEASLRAAVARAGPRSYVTGLRALRELQRMDPKDAEMAVARTVAGGHMAFARKAKRYTNAEQFHRTKYEGLAEAMAAMRRTHGPKEIADTWNRYTEFVFGSLNGRLESQFQIAMLGRALRDSPLMGDRTFKLSKAAVNQAARGLRETPTQIRLGREIDRMYGKYGKFSPGMRHAVAYYTPFLAWSLNAVQFVASVLPKDHPVLTALIASAEQVTEEWRKDHGLDLFMAGAAPGWLQGTIPLSGGRHLPVGRFTPFGAFGDTWETFTGNVLPQVSGVLDIGKHGIDWKGQVMRDADGQPLDPIDKTLAIGRTFVESTIPLVGLGERIAENGPKALLGGVKVYPGQKGAGGTKTSRAEDAKFDQQFKSAGGGGDISDEDFDRMMKALKP